MIRGLLGVNSDCYIEAKPATGRGAIPGMDDDQTDDDLLAEPIADVAFDVLTPLEGDVRGEFLQAFMRLAAQHGGVEIDEVLRLDPH